jgi:hypothetical protein
MLISYLIQIKNLNKSKKYSKFGVFFKDNKEILYYYLMLLKLLYRLWDIINHQLLIRHLKILENNLLKSKNFNNY